MAVRAARQALVGTSLEGTIVWASSGAGQRAGEAKAWGRADKEQLLGEAGSSVGIHCRAQWGPPRLIYFWDKSPVSGEAVPCCHCLPSPGALLELWWQRGWDGEEKAN